MPVRGSTYDGQDLAAGGHVAAAPWSRVPGAPPRGGERRSAEPRFSTLPALPTLPALAPRLLLNRLLLNRLLLNLLFLVLTSLSVTVVRAESPAGDAAVRPPATLHAASTASLAVIDPRHGVTGQRMERHPLAVLADSLRLLAQRSATAREQGDLPLLEVTIEEEGALLPAMATAMTRQPLPAAGTPARLAAIELSARLLRATQAGAWIDSLARRVERLPAADPDRPRLDFMTGVALVGVERFSDAARVLARSAGTVHPLAPEARVRAARALNRVLRDEQQGDRARLYRQEALALLDAIGGEGPLVPEATFLAVEIACSELASTIGCGDCIRRARSWVDRHPTRSGSPIASLLLAEALETDGQLAAAENACIELMARFPRATQAREAWTRYLRLRQGAGRTSTPRARLLAATAFAAQGARRDAVRELDRLLAERAEVDEQVKALLLKGKTLRRMGQPEQALAVLDSVQRAPSTVRQRYEAELWSGRALWSAGRIDDAAARYRQLAESGGGGEQAILAAWELGRMLEDEGRLDQAGAAFATLGRRHPRHRRAAEAIWRSGLCAYRLGRLEEAVATFAADRPTESADDRQRRLYWQGRVLEELGRREQALGTLDRAAAVWPRSYYGWRAAVRFTLLGEPDQGLPVRLVTTASRSPDRPPSTHGQHASHRPPEISGLTRTAQEALVRGFLLLELGLEDAARRDLRFVEREVDHDTVSMMQLAAAYVAHGIYDRAVSCGWTARQRLLGQPGELAALRFLYPIAFPAQVFSEARRNGVDPLLVLSLMRRESRFYPEALSRAGARGLMQLMPRTAAGVAKQIRGGSPSLRDLFQPEINVRLGTWYLASVMRDFAGRSDQALASYNAGKRKVEQWQQVVGVEDPDLFVELIGYGETRDYVRKVLNDYFYYQMIYGQAER